MKDLGIILERPIAGSEVMNYGNWTKIIFIYFFLGQLGQ